MNSVIFSLGAVEVTHCSKSTIDWLTVNKWRVASIFCVLGVLLHSNGQLTWYCELPLYLYAQKLAVAWVTMFWEGVIQSCMNSCLQSVCTHVPIPPA